MRNWFEKLLDWFLGKDSSELIRMAILLATHGASSDWYEERFLDRDSVVVQLVPPGQEIGSQHWAWAAPPPLEALIRTILAIDAPARVYRRPKAILEIGPFVLGPFTAFWWPKEPVRVFLDVRSSDVMNVSAHEVLAAAPAIVAFLTENGVSASEAEALVAAVQD